MSETEELIRKLELIEALFAGASSAGERAAAASAAERILRRLRETAQRDPPIEYRFTFDNVWSRQLFVALLRRYEIEPYRYYRQRRTTVMARVPRTFVDQTLWPEFDALNTALREHLEEVSARIIAEAISPDTSDIAEVSELKSG